MRKIFIGGIVAALAFLVGLATAPAYAAPTVRPTQVYLALGDSLAAGYQPGKGVDPTGGYAGRVLRLQKAVYTNTTLTNLGCPGERTDTMINGGICSYTEGSQLAAAEAFLDAHTNTSLITIDIGANNVASCVQADGSIDFACVQAGINQMQQDLPNIFGALRQHAPNARIIALNYYDPFLALWLAGRGSQGRSTANASISLLHSINNIIAGNATDSSINGEVADVATVFETDNTTRINFPPYGHPPTNVARICAWTYMCTQGDIHTNDTGYQKMASAVRSLYPPALVANVDLS